MLDHRMDDGIEKIDIALNIEAIFASIGHEVCLYDKRTLVAALSRGQARGPPIPRVWMLNLHHDSTFGQPAGSLAQSHDRCQEEPQTEDGHTMAANPV
jgi:hypothetical protein